MICFLLSFIGAKADDVVAFSVPDFSIKPGETKDISLVMTSSSDALKFNFYGEIVLPEGLTFVGEQVYDEENEEYFDQYVFRTDRLKASHAIEENLKSSNDLAFLVSAGTKFLSFNAGDAVLTFKVKAADNATIGVFDVQLVGMSAAGEDANEMVQEPNSTSSVNIYDLYKVELAANNAEMGTVEGATDEAMSNSEATVKATANEGYEFVNWTEGTTEVAITAEYKFTVTKDISLTANFKAKQYTITFDSDGGSDVESITADYKSTLTKPADPTKTGYTFAGWDPEFPETMPLNGAALKAKWTPIEYAITYDLAGGALAEGDTNPATYTIESAAITLKNPTKTGYTFAGWTGTDLTEASTAVTIAAGSTGARAYTATYTVNQYTVTFKLENGDADVVKTQDYGTELTAPTGFVKEGHTFTGWDVEVPATVPAENLTITAQWAVNSYAVKFIVDGEVVQEGNVEYGTAITKPADPEKTGYTFTGWNPEVPATMPAAEQTFTAQFSINQYTVTFKYEDNTGTAQESSVTQDYDTDLTSPLTVDVDTNKDGAPFVGWDNDYTGKVPAQNITYNAIYGGEYDVIFVVDGTEVQKTAVEYGNSFTAPADPTKEGYTFAGWLSQEDKALSEYPTMPAKALTFTAQWTINQYTVTFVLGNGAENVVLTQDYATTITAPADPVREGYTFAGWDPAVPATVPAQDLTITAKWTINQYTITFKLENGDNDVVLTQDYATAITAPTGFEKEGYTFTGWDAEVPATVPAQNLTFTAQWTINQYTLTFLADGAEFKKLTQDYGTAVKADFEAPDKEGYIWRGWDAEVPETMPAEDMTFNAVYEEFDGIVWNFKQTKALAGLITASADQWERTTANGTFRFTYQPKTNVEPLMLGEEELADTKGLLFKGGAAKFRIDANSRLGMNGANLQIIIPGLKRTQRITIECQSANSSSERTFTVSDNLEIVSGFEATTAKQVNIANVTTSGDAIFTTTSGMNITRIIVDAALLPETAEIAADELREELNKAIELYNSATASDEATAKLDQALIDAALLLASYDAGEEVTIEQLAECKDKLMEAEAAFENAIITTGISNVTTAAQEGVEAYTLGGQKMNLLKGDSQRKGIYIINGKKVVK